jgi:hypothetical protein
MKRVAMFLGAPLAYAVGGAVIYALMLATAIAGPMPEEPR